MSYLPGFLFYRKNPFYAGTCITDDFTGTAGSEPNTDNWQRFWADVAGGGNPPLLNGFGSLTIFAPDTYVFAPGSNSSAKFINPAVYGALSNTKNLRIETSFQITQLSANLSCLVALKIRTTRAIYYVNPDGYKVVFKKDGSGNCKIYFAENNIDDYNSSLEIGTFSLNTMMRIRVEILPTPSEDVIKVYKEDTFGSNNWTLLHETTVSNSSAGYPPYYSNSAVWLDAKSVSYGSGNAEAIFDYFKICNEEFTENLRSGVLFYKPPKLPTFQEVAIFSESFEYPNWFGTYDTGSIPSASFTGSVLFSETFDSGSWP